MCVRLQEEFEESKAQSEVNHTELCAFLRTANEQLTEEARRRYQDALAEVQVGPDCLSRLAVPRLSSSTSSASPPPPTTSLSPHLSTLPLSGFSISWTASGYPDIVAS